MKLIIVAIISLLLSVLAFKPETISPLTTRAQEAPAAFASKVILISWDAAQRNHVNEMLAARQLPNLQRLINEGAWRDMVIYTQNCNCDDGDSYHTSTGPGHAAMLTGYGFPEMKNHVISGKNSKARQDCPLVCPPGSPDSCYDEKLGHQPIPPGLTIFERIKTFNPNIKTGITSGKNYFFFPFDILENAADRECCQAGSGCLDKKSVNFCRIPLDAKDEAPLVTQRMINFLNKYSNLPFFLFSLYYNPDVAGHQYGENSPEFTNSLIENDQELGKIIRRLKELGIYQQTVILVTTDHGFEEGTTAHWYCVPETKDVWIVSNKANVVGRQGVISKQTSITPTIFDIFGMSKNVNPPFAGESLFVAVTPTPTPTPGVIKTLSLKISQGENDAWETADANKTVNTTSSEIKIGWYAKVAGLRFASPELLKLKNKTITKARLKIVASQTTSQAVKVKIFAENSGQPKIFEPLFANISSRPKTTAAVVWQPGAWVSGTVYPTPDLTSLVKEVVGRGDFSGQSMVLLLENAGSANYSERLFASFEKAVASAAVLEITYEE